MLDSFTYSLLDWAGIQAPPVSFTAMAPVKPKRQRPHPTPFRYVRKVKGRKYQARVWVGHANGGSLNLGLYDSDLEAWNVVKTWLRTGQLPEGVLPKYVVRRGESFVAICRKGGQRFETRRYRDPMQAHRAMRAMLAQAFPGRKKVRRDLFTRFAS